MKVRPPPHQQKDYNWLYCDTCFIAVVWRQTCDISDTPVWGLCQHKDIMGNVFEAPLSLSLNFSLPLFFK